SQIDLTGWRLVNSIGSVDIVLSGTIPAKGFFLLERAHELTVSDVTADQIYPGALGDINDSLTLSRPNGAIVDTANSDGGPWPAGTASPNFNSMERVVTGGVPAKDTASGWLSNTQASTWTKHNAAGGLIHGTPAGNNWAFTVVPTPSPKPPPATSTPGACNVTVNPTSIIINEIAWAGTAASTSDEWIELYNPTASTINLNGWVLRAVDGTPNIALANVDLPAGQYYLLERTDDTTVSDIIADQIFTGDIGNFSEALRLFNQFGVCVDAANSNGGAWPAGSSTTFGTMERRGVVPDSDTAWITNTGVKANGHDAGFPNTCTVTPPCSTAPKPLKGTPRQANWAILVTATPSPKPTITPRRTSTPTQVFIPAPPPPLIGINEFVPRPGHDWNNDGTLNVGDEYIELINHGVVDVNLSGYTLDDEANIGSNPYRLPSVVLKPGQRMAFYGKDTGLLLGDGGDGVRLLKPNGQLGDAYNYTVVKFPDQSYCRLPDNGGLDDWNQNCFPTPGLQNSLSGTFVRPPTEANVDDQLCPIADMLPSDFILAECPFFGNIWSRYYWDKDGWYGEKVIPDINSKWDVYVD
ncbi:MAG TPA: lamin tail domain-containing protein, partial [Anaerolineales bacterium]|nr:lamin tail domain-containing protein [Anaerolineales bacterium]